MRQHVWHWLEHELAVVNILTSLDSTDPAEFATSLSSTSPDGDRAVDLVSPVQTTSLSRAKRPLSGISVGKDRLSGDHYCAMNRGPLTTPSYLIQLNSCEPRSGSSKPSDSSNKQRDTLCASAAIFLSPSTILTETREAELERIRIRLQWLRNHKAFLTSLINFCGLYGASGVGLPAVRTELLLLLTELYTYPAYQPQPISPFMNIGSSGTDGSIGSQSPLLTGRSTSVLPWPSSTIGLVDGIPLLRTTLHLPPGVLLLPDPIKHIQCMIHDLISCLESLPPPYLTTAILPCPYHASKSGSSSTEPATMQQSKLESTALRPSDQLKGTSDTECSYCSLCATAPTRNRQRRVFLLRNLCAALAVCLHQCLSTGGWLGPGQDMKGGSLGCISLPASTGMTNRSVDRLIASGQPLKPNTEPSRWPGE
ncbi:unnamed protein product [Echinostoma caproni]|uniref:Uncharacterized protein n=1 Tax=Echinostoma caproni TaxID=27848 RepID=A0A3P8L9V4_9TREM|nr:unnamed protein product [Echinostoma caproni]